MGIRAAAIHLTEQQRDILVQLERADKTPQRLAERARLVLLAERGKTNLDVASALAIDRQCVRRWRTRYSKAAEMLATVEREGSRNELRDVMINLLSDQPRPGMPSRFTAEHVAQLIAISCRKPEEYDVPISHWTPPELARVLVKQGIVESISPRQVDRFLKRSRNPSPQDAMLAESTD